MGIERDFSRKVLKQSVVVNKEIEVKYFEIDLNSDSGVLNEYDAIEQQVGIWFNTNIGERYFNYAYGNPIIELVHLDRKDLKKESIERFYNKLEEDVETVKVNRTSSEVYVLNNTLHLKVYLYVAGLTDTITINQEISV